MRRLLKTAPIAALLLLGGCIENAPLDSLDPQGPIARDIDDLFWLVMWIAGVILVIVMGALLVALVLFRDRPGRKDPKQVHGNATLEVVWTVIPVVILASIAVPTVQRVFEYTECSDDALHIEVIGHQWWFEYYYPDHDIYSANVLVIPEETEICLDMTSDDVLHNYWIPQLNGKRYLVPGQETLLLLNADDPGEYWGHCAEFCGLSHALMRARVQALTQADYDQWLLDQQQGPVEPAPGSLEEEGLNTFLAAGCTQCHNVTGVNEVPDPIGPNLTHFASRNVFAGAIFELDDPNHLAEWLANPPELKPGSFMPNLNLTSDQIEALEAWLRSLD